MSAVGLRRELGPVALLVYGVGGMLGGGIYALVGEVAGRAGRWSWLAFALAMLAAAPTALSYAELASRHPRSAGEAAFVRRASGRRDLAFLTGWIVLLSGVVSVATLARALAGYLERAAPGWGEVLAGAGLVLLAAIAAWGIRLTARANALCTAVELGGLVLVVGAGVALLLGDGARAPPRAPPGEAGLGLGVLSGAALAFYAYVGFEDMVNVAEEVRRPRRVLPLALLAAVAIVGTTYLAVAWVAVAAVGAPELAGSEAPLQEVVARGAPWLPGGAFTTIAVFAVANTALLNVVMASRLAYGMAQQGLLPAWIGAVHARRRTPVRAVVAAALAAGGLAAWGGLEVLAGTTSLLILVLFAGVDLSLAHLKRREPDHGGFHVPSAVPWLGVVASLGLAAFAPRGSLVAAGLLVGLGAVLGVLRARTMDRRSP